MAQRYDLIVVGLEKAGLTAARIVKLAGWSVLILGLKLLDSLAHASSGTGAFLAQLESEGIHFVRGSPRFVDRRILEVEGLRYEGRHVFVTSNNHASLTLACAEVEVRGDQVVVDDQQRSTSNPSITFTEAYEQSSTTFSDAHASAEGLRIARRILGIEPELSSDASPRKNDYGSGHPI